MNTKLNKKSLHAKYAFISCMCFSALSCFGQVSGNVDLTVDRLVLIDAQQAAKKIEDEMSGTELFKQPSSMVVKESQKNVTKIIASPPPKWIVKNIYGLIGQSKADLLVESHQSIGSGVGSVINGCVVKSIENKCLIIEPVPLVADLKKTGSKAKKTKPKLPVCPKIACWTGDEIANEVNPPQETVSSAPNSQKTAPLPLPFPLPVK